MMSNEEIRKIVKEKTKGGFLNICAKIFLIGLATSLVFLPLDLILAFSIDEYSSDTAQIISELISGISDFIITNITLLLSTIFIFKTLRDEKEIKLFSPLEQTGKCMSFLGFSIYFYIRILLWFIPLFIIPYVILLFTVSSSMIYSGMGDLSIIVLGLSVIYIIIAILFLSYKTISYSFATFLYIDIENISYSKAISLSVYMTENEKFKLIKFNLKNMLKLELIPSVIVIFFGLMCLSGDEAMLVLFLIILVIYAFYSVLIVGPYMFLMNTEYYFQLKEHKKIAE